MLGLVSALSPILNQVLGAFLPDPGKRQEVILQILTMFSQSDEAQNAVNKAEAKHSSVFVAGWRPAIGWTFASALAVQYVVSPIIVWASSLLGYSVPPIVKFDDMLWELMFGMLGMGALRSFEKYRGITK